MSLLEFGLLYIHFLYIEHRDFVLGRLKIALIMSFFLAFTIHTYNYTGIEESNIFFRKFTLDKPGKARIRVQLSAAHEKEHLDRAIAAFTKVGKELGVVE